MCPRCTSYFVSFQSSRSSKSDSQTYQEVQDQPTVTKREGRLGGSGLDWRVGLPSLLDLGDRPPSGLRCSGPLTYLSPGNTWKTEGLEVGLRRRSKGCPDGSVMLRVEVLK